MSGNNLEDYREYTNDVDTFYFNRFQAYALSSIYSIETAIVNSNELTGIQ